MAEKKKIALLGAGTMGVGIAQMFAQAIDPETRTFHAHWNVIGEPDARAGSVELLAFVWRSGADTTMPLLCKASPDLARLLPRLRASGPKVPLALLPKP